MAPQITKSTPEPRGPQPPTVSQRFSAWNDYRRQSSPYKPQARSLVFSRSPQPGGRSMDGQVCRSGFQEYLSSALPPESTRSSACLPPLLPSLRRPTRRGCGRISRDNQNAAEPGPFPVERGQRYPHSAGECQFVSRFKKIREAAVATPEVFISEPRVGGVKYGTLTGLSRRPRWIFLRLMTCI